MLRLELWKKSWKNSSCLTVLFLPFIIFCLESVFISIGTAEGLRRRGIYLCTEAIRDEGVSSHYLKHAKYAHPNPSHSHKLPVVKAAFHTTALIERLLPW